MNKEWLDLDEEIESLSLRDDYIYVDLGVNTVDPSKIIALSRELDQGRLEALRDSISKNGWQDIMPRTIHLILLPGDRYAVESGGNHRAVVSNEFKIEKIQATVGTFIEKSLLSNEELLSIEGKEARLPELHKLLRQETNEDKMNAISEEITSLKEAVDSILINAYKRIN